MATQRKPNRNLPSEQRPPSPPPGDAERLLKFLHSDRGRFTHLGDFEEVYRDIQTRHGVFRAGMWYRLQVLKSVPGFITNRLYWSVAMMKNHITIAFRNIFKNRGFSLINIAGLAVGMACFLLISAYVRSEWSYDRFLPEGDRIYRMLGRSTGEEDVSRGGELNDHFPEMIAPLIENEIPDVEAATRFMRAFGKPSVLRVDDKPFTQDGLYADHKFLEVMGFPLLRGRPDTVLKDPGAIVITQSLARKLFGDSDPMGRAIAYREKRREYEVTVSGVLSDIPANSSLRFDYLLSLATVRGDKRNAFMFDNMNVGNFMIFLKLGAGARPEAAERKLLDFANSKGVTHTELVLQPIRDIHLRSSIRGQRETNNQVRFLYIFSSIALVILLVACINAMNLATARAATRAREIGIRKVSGAGRGQLVRQFFGESIFMAAAAMLIALALVRILLPVFQRLLQAELEFKLLRNPEILILVIATTLFVGLLSGSYPAVFLSGLQPVGSFRDYAASGSKGGRLRNILVVIQFAASIILIIVTLIIFGQMNYIKTKNLGFNREQVMIIPIHENETQSKQAAIRQAFLQHPRVEGVSISSGLPIEINSRLINFKLQNNDGETVKPEIHFDYVDENFLDVFEIDLARGRNFSREFSTDESGALVNQALVDSIGWEEPLGRTLPFTFINPDGVQIIGVVNNFYFSTLHSAIKPMALIFRPGSNICIRIQPEDLSGTIASLKGIFEAETRGQPFDFYFLDDAFNRLYQKELRTGEIFGAFAGLTVLIACLGLFGLAAFAVERRTKEIGIRKVMGASPSRLVGMLSGHFTRMVLVANLIAWPTAYLLIRRWLEDFTYRIGIGAGPFLLAAGAALLIALLTISVHTLRAAAANPVDTLRYE